MLRISRCLSLRRYFLSNIIFPALCGSCLVADVLAGCPPDFPEGPALSAHIEQIDIKAGQYRFWDLFDKGKELFTTKMNLCDGQGRPATTGGGAKRIPDEIDMIRTSGPDANACSGCHAEPFAGGSGDFVANVFVLAQTLDPVTESVSPEFSNERNTLGMHGAGPIEMLAREMTKDLQAQAAALPDGKHTLRTKGVSFDIVKSNGEVIAAEGVDTDLIVKPFHQAGVVTSIRQFTVNAMNHHHGMQAEERFDLNPVKGFDTDYDEDGVERELTIGDITAITLFQAALATPTQLMPRDPSAAAQVQRGERLFAQVGCTDCHRPALHLDHRRFVEPNPFNPADTWRDASMSYSFDLTRQGELPRLPRSRTGAWVKAYTDLKRHNLCDPEEVPDAIRYFCNERLDQGRPAQDGRPGSEFFLTRKLWDVGSSAPYGHRGDLSTISEAVFYHGGEARSARNAFVALDTEAQASIISFLKTLQVVPRTTHSARR